MHPMVEPIAPATRVALLCILLGCVHADAQHGNDGHIAPPASFQATAFRAPRGDSVTRDSAGRIDLPPLLHSDITTYRNIHRTAVGQNRRLSGEAPQSGWTTNSAGEPVWTVAVRAAAAAGLRVHFRSFDVGAAQVWVHDGSVGTGHVFGPYTGKGPMLDGDFWTEMVAGDSVWIEYDPPAGAVRVAVPFDVPEVFQLWSGLLSGQPASTNVSCFLDAACYASDPVAYRMSRATAYLIFADHTCSGTLINDRHATSTPYLLTAGHCIWNSADARSMLAVFNFRSASCGAAERASYSQVSGATLLARSLHTPDGNTIIADRPDFAFVRLMKFPDSDWYAAGWDDSGGEGSVLTSISHPRGLPQKLAHARVNDASDPNFYLLDFYEGAVDHGSSGSSIVNDSMRVLGVDSYGFNGEDVSACDGGGRSAGYTKFSAIYPAIQQWLEAEVVQGPQLSPVSLDFGNVKSGSTSDRQTAVLTNSSGSTIPVSRIAIAGADASQFMQTNDCGSTMPAGVSCTIIVSFTPDSPGNKIAALSINGSPRTIALSGTGTLSAAPPLVMHAATALSDPIVHGACATPEPVAVFRTDSRAVFLYFDVKGAAATDLFHVNYYRPDGAIYATVRSPSNYSGYECFSSYVRIAGYPAAALPGSWKIRVFWNDSETPIATRTFVIAHDAIRH